MDNKAPPPVAFEDRHNDDERMFSPSVARNREAISAAFEDLGITAGRVLEIGSGTGEHAAFMLETFPDLIWTASDPDEASRNSCEAWARHCDIENRMLTETLDVLSDAWPNWRETYDYIYCANVVHISPFALTERLIGLARLHLNENGRLILYGPFRRDGVFTASSNAQFHQSLQSRHPEWGVRDLEQDIIPLAYKSGLSLTEIRDMPANNNLVVFSV